MSYFQHVTFLSLIRDRQSDSAGWHSRLKTRARLGSAVFATLQVNLNWVRSPSSFVLFSIWLLSFFAAPLGRGEVAANPYLGIPERNAFGIKPPPPPPPEPKAIEIPKSPTNVVLTGFSEFDDGKVVYLMFTAIGAKSPEYISLHEGDAHNGVEVLQIDLASESVRIRQNGTESVLDYKSNGNKAPGGPGVPGTPAIFAQPNAPVSGPVVIRRGGVAETQATPIYAPPTAPYTPPLNMGGGGGGLGAFPGSPNPNLTIPASGRIPENSTGGGRVIPALPSPTIPHPRNPNLPAVPIPPIPPLPGGQPLPQ